VPEPTQKGPLQIEEATARAARLEAAPAWLRMLVRFMDDAIPIPGTRYRLGLDSFLGFLVPGAGDAVSALSHVALLFSAFRARVPRVVMMRMVLNAAMDALTGTVPVAGDLFDVAFKANRKNLELLERTDKQVQRAPTFGDYVVLCAAVLGVLLLMSIPIMVGVALYAWIARR
jgi:hypothetical protein